MVRSDNASLIFEPSYYQHLHDIEERHWWAMGMRDIMAALLQKPLADRERLKVLDIGCGTGYLLHYLKRYPLADEAVGIDLSPYALGFCRQRGASTLVLADAVHPPFAPASFDLVICLDTLQHLSPAGADRIAVAHFARLLKPGGLLYLRTNSALGHATLRGADPNLYRRYRRPELSAMLRQKGLRIEHASYANCLPAVWAMLRECLSPTRHPTAPIGPGLSIRLPRLAALNRLLHSVLGFEAYLIGRLGLELPFGHSIVILARKP